MNSNPANHGGSANAEDAGSLVDADYFDGADRQRAESSNPGSDMPVPGFSPDELARYGYSRELPEIWRRRQRKCLPLFVLTCLSTFLIGAGFFPQILFDEGRKLIFAGNNLKLGAWDGLQYSVAVMTILVFHEMGHFLQARRYGVPATWPFFIPMPLPPLGTMGAVIVQQAGVANRKALFDIAVSGPIAGLVVAMPVLFYGIKTSGFVPAIDPTQGAIEFGEPLVMQWMVEAVHGPRPEGMDFGLNSLLFAGWVGVLITSLNLIPAGQLDGGHIMYTLIGRKAHYLAYAVLVGAFAYMVYIKYPAYLLLFVLIMFMGPKHPPTSDDRVALGWPRIVIGWLTMAFILIGFTVRPITIHEPVEDDPAPGPVPVAVETALN